MPTKNKMPLPYDDAYLQIWKIEQDHTRTRWTVTTFFLSISFAILGLSFQVQPNSLQIFGLSLPDMQRIIGLLIFWIGYALFMQFNRYSYFLRSRMRDMEKQKLVSFTLQSDAKPFMYSKLAAAFSASWLLFYFGLIYTAIVILLIVLS